MHIICECWTWPSVKYNKVVFTVINFLRPSGFKDTFAMFCELYIDMYLLLIPTHLIVSLFIIQHWNIMVLTIVIFSRKKAMHQDPEQYGTS